jgi:predicted nucleic acid-binding protein
VRDVVTNTSPLLYLHQLRLIDLLPRLYERVVVPTAVAEELAEGARHGHDVPNPARLDWALIIAAPSPALLKLAPALGEGERAAIALASERGSDLLLIDDGPARRHATLLGIKITGTLGVLLRAKANGHLPAVQPLLDQLAQLGFRASPETIAAVRKLADEA